MRKNKIKVSAPSRIFDVFNVLLTATGAYFLSRKNVMLQMPVMLYVMFTMFFSGGMIPFYFTVKDLGLYYTSTMRIQVGFRAGILPKLPITTVKDACIYIPAYTMKTGTNT